MDAALQLPAAEKAAALSALLAQHVAARDRDAVGALAAAALDQARCPRAACAEVLRRLPPLLEVVVGAAGAGDCAFAEGVCMGVVDALKAASAGDLDDVDVALRNVLYDVKTAQGQFYAAGQALACAKIDSAAALDPATKAYLWVRVVQAFMRCEDDVSAERYIKRASDLHRHMTKDVQMMHLTVMAQMQDFRRTKDGNNFQQAALKYEDVSRRGLALGFPADELLHFLGEAVRCILLAPVGPARMRIMGSLSRDERIGFIKVRGGGSGVRRERAPPRARASHSRTSPHPLSSPTPRSTPPHPLPPAAHAALHAAAHEHGAPHLCARRGRL